MGSQGRPKSCSRVHLDPIAARMWKKSRFGAVGGESIDSKGGTKAAYGMAMAIIDDSLIVSFGDRSVHEQLLLKVLMALDDAMARIQPSKCDVFRSSVGLPTKTNTIRNFPALTNLKSVRSFVSLCSFYRRYIKDFAEIAQPLTDLLRNDEWRDPTAPDTVKAIDQLKTVMTTAPVLAYFDVTAPTELLTDASGVSIGGVVQQSDNEGHTRPVSYYSRRLIPTETNYHTYERGLLALKETLLSFRHWLLGIPIAVRTDHHSLKWILNQASEFTGKRLRWLAKISEFDVTEITHIPGKDSIVADVLSRYPDSEGINFEESMLPYGNMDVKFSSLEQVLAYKLVNSLPNSDVVPSSEHDLSEHLDVVSETSRPDRLHVYGCQCRVCQGACRCKVCCGLAWILHLPLSCAADDSRT